MNKQVKNFSIIPELRLQDDFTIDEYISDGKRGYEPFKFIRFAEAYRLNAKFNKKHKMGLYY